MDLRIALAGNPNSGKTTLFNALTGSNQFVGNWPGVTVEKKEGKLKKHEGVIVTDLPGIYSLSPYTLEEVVARKYLIEERPDVILNIVDGTNLERNLYLSTQLFEIGIPVVIAINMVDILRKNGDKIDLDGLSKAMGCPVVEISALKGDGIEEAAAALDAMSAPLSLSDFAYGEEDGTLLEDTIADKDSLEYNKRFFDRMALREAISKMNDRWQKILVLRFFRNKTQQQVADALGLTQVKVSREEKKIVDFLRKELK